MATTTEEDILARATAECLKAQHILDILDSHVNHTWLPFHQRLQRVHSEIQQLSYEATNVADTVEDAIMEHQKEDDQHGIHVSSPLPSHHHLQQSSNSVTARNNSYLSTSAYNNNNNSTLNDSSVSVPLGDVSAVLNTTNASRRAAGGAEQQHFTAYPPVTGGGGMSSSSETNNNNNTHTYRYSSSPPNQQRRQELLQEIEAGTFDQKYDEDEQIRLLEEELVRKEHQLLRMRYRDAVQRRDQRY